MNPLVYPIALPIIAGFLCLFVPKKLRGIKEGLALIASLATFALTIWLFFERPLDWSVSEALFLRLDGLSSFILMASGLFGVLIVLYSLKYIPTFVSRVDPEGKSRLGEYYAYILWTIGAGCGVLLANNFVLLIVFWGFLGLTLYLLIGIGGPDARPAAMKSFIIVGGSDCLMILGVGIIWFLTKELEMHAVTLPLSGTLPAVAFLCLAAACFAKAGAMPVHTWIPDCAEKAPIPVTAFLPASLDKLLGIYLLARISLHLFELKVASAMSLVLLIVGAVTVIGAVMMALVQHDLKRLLSYHAVSQVGYMVLGIGTANPIGIAGGLFHMLNHAIYKGCLFLCGGGVEHRAGTTDLDRLGGLAKVMPITFVTCFIAALSISGVPPFNGFISKWMVYQGIIELSKGGDKLWIIWLVAAMFGSALTLASFMKVIHATFLGRPSADNRERSTKIKEVGFTMWVPMVVLAGLCVIFGVFAYAVPLRHLIFPSVPNMPPTEEWLGWWRPGPATLLILIGIVVGAIIYWLGSLKGLREDSSFIGGEVIPDEHRVTGVDFYDTIRDFRLLKGVYNGAGKGFFDIYYAGANVIALFTKAVQRVHTGLLTAYFSWFLAGLLILIYILMKVTERLP